METSNEDYGPQVGEIAGEAQARAHLSVDELKERLKEINERIKGFIRERPAACLLGALAVGYVVARLARRER